MTKFEKQLKSFPPFLVRLCARKSRGRVWMTRADIIRISGLAGRVIDKISIARTWGKFDIDTVIAYTTACDVDLATLRRHKDYIKRRKQLAWRDRPDLIAKIFGKTN